ncbi:MAG TPA: lipase maturation factor family protein [Candidatus Eisenbacteria bacterium]|nr:lipase maturation factor family protein [Candidatus Eisenbacteria bacterium]
MTPAKPLLLFDGTCSFCRLWIARWQHVLGDRIEIVPSQEAPPRAAGIDPEAFARALHLVEPSGRVSRGAEAVFRSLAYAPGHGWPLFLYRFMPGFAPLSEACYAWVAAHRPLCERLTLAIWGAHVVPPGERRTAWIFLRALGGVYLIAFVSLWTQVIGLAGRDGILSAYDYLEGARRGYGAIRYWLLPTFAWLSASDAALHAQCALGVLASLLVVLGFAPALALLACWALYLSLVGVGQQFFWFQWDGLLLETGLLAIFLAPLGLRSRLGRDPPPSRLALWSLRALLFRLMVSSAIVKISSGDPAWRSLTALEVHYQTQCLPTWIAWYAHHLPPWFHRGSAIGMFVVEGLVPFLILAPRRIRFAAAAVLVGFQVLIAVTGNYGFFNLLTVVLCILLLDDGAWPWRKPGVDASSGARWPAWVLRPALTLLLVVSLVPLLGTTRFPVQRLGPIADLFRFVSPFRSVNRYGLFAVMTTRRHEIVIEGSNDGTTWREYGFRWKPGDVRRRPAFVAPHQPRLDWQMWFAVLSDFRDDPWFLTFCQRLLEGSRPVLALMAENPFPEAPPRYLRATVYEYRFTDGATRRASGAWWTRELKGLYCPVLTMENGRIAPVMGGAP